MHRAPASQPFASRVSGVHLKEVPGETGCILNQFAAGRVPVVKSIIGLHVHRILEIEAQDPCTGNCPMSLLDRLDEFGGEPVRASPGRCLLEIVASMLEPQTQDGALYSPADLP